MGKKAISYVVREVPHPKYPKGTIVFSAGVYELPDGSRWKVANDQYVTTVTPPTNRSNLADIPSYGQ